MNILITGGLGFIGTNLTKYLLTKKNINKIIIIDSFQKTSIDNIKSFTKFKFFKSISLYKESNTKVCIVKGDIKNSNFAIRLTKNIDFVVHLAAESGVDASIIKPRLSFENNVLGAFNYLEACRINNVKRFIFASSGAVFGLHKPPLKENMPKQPISPYGSSKLAIETYAETFSNVFKFKATVLRFSNAYGKYSQHKTSVISKFIKSANNNENLIVNGDGNHTRDFIHIDDITNAIYLSFKDKNNFSAYHVATKRETSLNELIKIFQKCYSKYNINLSIINSKERLGDMKKNYSSADKIKKNLGWTSKVKLEKGIKETIDWYING
tara:strand:+ start:1733 stop:2707 length:975 start_codon:yes stop_codon:yes gene_type:complete